MDEKPFAPEVIPTRRAFLLVQFREKGCADLFRLIAFKEALLEIV